MMNILMTSSAESFLQLLGSILIFLAVLALVFFTTKWMGGFQKARSSTGNLRIVESIGVGNNKFISIVEAGSRYLVVAVGKDEIHLLAELDREEIAESAAEAAQSGFGGESFSRLLEQVRGKHSGGRDKNNQS